MNCLKFAYSTVVSAVVFTGALVALESAPSVDPSPPLDPGFSTQLYGGAFSRPQNFIAVSDGPQVSITATQENLVIRWSVDAIGWVLEQSPSLDSWVSWKRVPLALYETNAATISITLSASEQDMFYRLAQPISIGLPVPGLTAGWTFDEGQGDTAPDLTGRENSAVLNNVAWITGRIGSGALAFNGGPAGAGGSRAWVSNDNYRVLPPQGHPFTVSLWFNPDTLMNGWRGLIGNDANGSNGWRVALHNSGPGTNELVFASSGPDALNITGRKLLLPGQWYELTATYDGSEGFIYLDSELLARGSGALQSNNGPIYIGGGVGGYDSFPGAIDEVRAYSVALAQEDISLAGEWHMDEGIGNFTVDSSIHSHYGTVSDSTAWVTGKQGSGLTLSNGTMQIRNDSMDVLPPTGKPFSISSWLYPGLLPSGSNVLMSCANAANAGWQLALSDDGFGSTRLRFWSTDSGGTLDLSAPIALPATKWSKLDLTYNGGIATLYANGRKVLASSGGIQGSAAPLVLGGPPGTTNFNGIIDELKIYRRERTEAEIGPVAKVMWETAFVNTATNLPLQGFGPGGKQLTYSIDGSASPTNGTVTIEPGSSTVTYTAGSRKGPDAFAYTVSDGEFTSPPTMVALSIVEPHWLSPTGGAALPLDGSAPDQAWLAGPADALDAIWKTNKYYDCFFYAPGEYQTTGWKYQERSTVNPGCKHIGSGSEGSNQTTIKLVNTWDAWGEGFIFGLDGQVVGDGFEVRDMLLDCNAANNPKYAVGEPVSIIIPLATTSRVDTVILHWDNAQLYGTAFWQFGPAREFNLCTRVAGANGYITNCTTVTSTGRVDVVSVGATTDQIILQLTRRVAGVDFYGLAEVEVSGAAVSLPTATVPGAGESRLNTNNANYSILHIVDGNDGTVWASGPEDQVEIVIPLEAGTTVSQVNLAWNCHLIPGVGQLGPAANYQIQTRDPDTGAYRDVPFVRQQRTPRGMEPNTFATPIVTDQLLIRLTARELGVDFYSLGEVQLQNGSGAVPVRLPTAFNSLSWDKNYQILRAFDGDAATQWASGTQGMIGAIVAVGNNLKFTRLKVVGFGTKAARECFVLVAHPPTSDVPGLPGYGNVLVEDCVFSEPAHDNKDGLTTVSVFGLPYRPQTNTIVQRCSVTGVKPYFGYSHGFTSIDVENCFVADCQVAVYFEPSRGWGDNLGPVLVRSNRFVNVDAGVYSFSHSAAQFDSITMLDNAIVLSGAGVGGFAGCDVCEAGPSGSITNVTILNSIIRYADWSSRPGSGDQGLVASDIRNAVFGNNLITLADPLRVRQCPGGYIPPQTQPETCDFVVPPPPPPPTFPPCLDYLPPGYRRAWFNNRDLQGDLLRVRYWNYGDGFASQQQWP